MPLARLAAAARWTAIAIAVAAVLDPSLPLPRRARPSLRLIGAPGDALSSVARQLRDAGFTLDEPDGEVAEVLVGAPSTWYGAPSSEHSVPLWALDTTPPPPDVRIVDATGPTLRLPGQAVDVRVTLAARGMTGQTSEIVLEDAGIVVASARHQWRSAVEQWHGSLGYLPPGAAGGRLTVRIAAQAAEISVPPLRGPIRTLVVEAGVTWPAMFVRRALEGEPAFAVAAVQRASTRIATRAGGPPIALTRDALAPFEVALVGAPENLTAGDLEALRWFVDERGGVAVVIPDRPPGGRYLELIGGPLLTQRVVETPVPLRQPVPSGLEGRANPSAEGLMASELVIATRLPAGARTLAATEAGDAVVFAARRGLGAVIYSGALDAWRFRARDEDAFARFWRQAIVEEAATVPPALEVSADPPVAGVGAPVRVLARLRATELPAGTPMLDLDQVSARAVSPGARVDAAVRLWPTAEPGVYEGEWRPPAAGGYNIAVTAGARRGDAAVIVGAPVARGEPADPEGLALAAAASGGRVFPAERSAALVEELTQAFPARTSVRTSNPMRSPVWVVPFSALLCAEWAMRRRRGLA